MNYLLVLAHPEPDSFNGACRDLAVKRLKAEGHRVSISDLYAMEWEARGDERDFVALENDDYFKYQKEQLHASANGLFSDDIVAEQKKLEWCDCLVLIFPLWWFSMPAILKGWVDRVMAMGYSYGGGTWYDNGHFAGKRAMLAISTGGPEHVFTDRGINGSMEKILFHINHGILYFNGFTVVEPVISWGVARADEDQRKQYLQRFAGRVLNIESAPVISYPRLEDYDDRYLLKKED